MTAGASRSQYDGRACQIRIPLEETTPPAGCGTRPYMDVASGQRLASPSASPIVNAIAVSEDPP